MIRQSFWEFSYILMYLMHQEVPEFFISALKNTFGWIIPSWNKVKSQKKRWSIKWTLYVCPEFSVLEDCYTVMRCFRKSLLLLLENFRIKNSILVYEIIDQTLSFIFTTFYYCFKLNQRNLYYMNSKLPKINL